MGQLVLQFQRPVGKTAGVEEFLQRQPAGSLPGFQLLIAGILLFNVPGGVGDIVRVQPGLGLFAGRAGGDIPETASCITPLRIV